MSVLSAQLKKLQQKQGIKFKLGFMNQFAKKLLTPEVISMLKNSEGKWALQEMEFSNHPEKWSKLFEFLEECSITFLLLGKNNRNTILKQISRPNYISLEHLTLNNNKIDTKLSKTQFSRPFLQLYRLDITDLQRAPLLHLKTLVLQEKQRDIVVSQSLRWLFKSSTPNLTQLYCASRKRMREEPVWKELSAKYPQGKIKLA